MSDARSLLIVDDEQVIRDLCSELLAREGYAVESAENGMTALKMIRKSNFDVVLVDVNMPVMNGIELLESIKRDYPHLEVIIMTAFGTIQNAIEAMRKGAFDFILKPFNLDQIQVVTKKCIEKIDRDKENQELRNVNEKLREIQEMKDKFIAITSHELRTPLSHIKGYVGILNDELADSIPEKDKKEFWKIVKSAVEQLEHIVNNMYGIAKIDNQGVRVKKQKFNLHEMLKQMKTEYQLTLTERRQRLNLSLSGDFTIFHGDRLKVKQMCTALIDNAIKYTPDGGDICLSTSQDKNYCIVTVSDNGIGIPQDKLGQIFEKFYEVQDTDYHSTSQTDFLGGGIGLGLSIAKAIAEAHGGGIKVISKVNEGTNFKIFLPWE